MHLFKKVLVSVVLLLCAGGDVAWATGVSGSAATNIAGLSHNHTGINFNNISANSAFGSSALSTKQHYRSASRAASLSYKPASSNSTYPSYSSSYSHTKALHTTTGSLNSYISGSGLSTSHSSSRSANTTANTGGISVGNSTYSAPYYNSQHNTSQQTLTLYQPDFGILADHNRTNAAAALLNRGIKRVPVLGDDDKWYDDETGEECDPPSTAVGYKDPVTGKIWNGTEWIDNATEIFPLGSAPWLLVVIMLTTYISIKRIRKKA